VGGGGIHLTKSGLILGHDGSINYKDNFIFDHQMLKIKINKKINQTVLKNKTNSNLKIN
jgi:hypothetical protein